MDIQRRLSHTNIVQFRGACCEYADLSAITSRTSGPLNEYGSSDTGGLQQYPSCGRPQPMLASACRPP